MPSIIANRILAEYGFPVAKTRVFEFERRIFLESERFDRLNVTGRRGVVSLRALDAAHIGGANTNWPETARAFHAAGWIEACDRDTITRLHCFGALIGNTDMHPGNISFFSTEERPLLLCPVYDMLPMRFRPSASGEIRDLSLTLNLPRPEDEKAWHEMWPAAHAFWQNIAKSTDFSKDFRKLATDSIQKLRKIRSTGSAR